MVKGRMEKKKGKKGAFRSNLLLNLKSADSNSEAVLFSLLFLVYLLSLST